MLECQESGVKSTHSHRISFSISDILDPMKFTRRNDDEHSTVKAVYNQSLESCGAHVFRDQNDTAESSLSGKHAGK